MTSYDQLKIEVLTRYCSYGWNILPTWWVTEDENGRRCACQLGRVCRKPGKHPRISEWQKKATCGIGTVLDWHAAWPLANWGWVQDRTFTIDVDTARGGMDSLEEWIGFTGGPPATLTQGTASGGRHYIYHQPIGDDLGEVPQVPDFMPGIEVRGVGSYIMIEPSVGVLGGWTFLGEDSSLPGQVATCDADTLQLIRARQSGTVTRNEEGSRRTSNDGVSDLPPTAQFKREGFGFHSGSRNVDAYRLAWRMLALIDSGRTTWDEAVADMYICWLHTYQGDQPFPWDEVSGCMSSARKRRERQKEETRREREQQRVIALRTADNWAAMGDI